MRNKLSWGLPVGLFSVLCLVVVGFFAGNAFAGSGKKHVGHGNNGGHGNNDGYQYMPSSGEHKNMKLIGYNDLQGRETLQVLAKEGWAYVGHHNRPGTATIHFNPLTQQDEENGTTILYISDPYSPRIVAHIPNPETRNSRSIAVVYN